MISLQDILCCEPRSGAISGNMTVKSLRTHLEKKGKSSSSIEAIIKAVDIDGDGMITADELVGSLDYIRTEGGFLLSSKLSDAPHVAMGASSVCNGASVVTTPKGRALLIIDPQVDFVTGALAVPGAVEDTARTVKLLAANEKEFEKVYVTLDTHHEMHIAHAAYWVAADGVTRPKPFTSITVADIKAGNWRPRVGSEMLWAMEYCTRLEAGGRFTLIIWPTHCLLGSGGHAVEPGLSAALNGWAATQGTSVSWVLKGQNNRTEMYSALKAEVVLDDDPATGLNQSLINALAKHTQVIICGQAMSHCVAETTKDLLSGWPKGRAADIVLLTDGASPVAGFEKAADAFQAEMKAAGVTLCTVAEFAKTL